jgi:lysine 2,3-aminomutase
VSAELPERVSAYYRSLARSLDPTNDPIAAQFRTSTQENEWKPYESADPLSDASYETVPRLIHHYQRRALVLANDQCAMYCRHCFRRHLTGGGSAEITTDEITALADYLGEHDEIVEVVISGGDPLFMQADRLISLLATIREARPDVTLRISTRVPVVVPTRVTEHLAERISECGPVWLVIQCNHPAEITDRFHTAIGHVRNAGIPILNQSVLLRGVNDSSEVLAELFERLVNARVKPYYLFQGDLAVGTSHFRVNLDRGLELMKTLRGMLSGLALPRYAVDLPGGGGKIELTESTVVRRELEWYLLRDGSGREYRYPREHAQ